MDSSEMKRKLIVKVGDSVVHLRFRWEHCDWVCRMSNDFMEELLEESEEDNG